MKIIVYIAVAILLIWALFFRGGDTWQGLYELPDNSGRIRTSEQFKTQEECRNWMNGIRATMPEAYNIECGSNCKSPERINAPWVCDTTFDG